MANENIDVRASVKGATEAMKSLGDVMMRMQDAAFEASIKLRLPVGRLYCDYLDVFISVYEPIGWFKRLMLRWCFGLKYREIENENKL